MKVQRTSIGLDVHARSVVGCALDGDTGEVFQRRLTPDHREIREWLTDLPAPVAVTYEAGPTGFGLARALIGAGIDCRVAAPSKLQRPAGDRVKTDARDAAHLARLLHLGQIVEVRIPTVAQEAARDLVRAREDCRGDVMTSRHRISKLLLRQGIVYYGGQAWTGKHEMWLRAQRFDSPALMLAYESALDAMVAGVHRRDRLDEAITAMAADSEFTPVVTRLGCLRGVSTLTAFGLAVVNRRLAPADRALDRRLPGFGAVRVLLGHGTGPGWGHQDRQQPCPPSAGRSGLASPQRLSARTRPAAPLGCRHRGRTSARACRQPSAAHPVGQLRPAQETPGGRQRRDCP